MDAKVIQIDQMSLADVGGNPTKLAQAIISQLEDQGPRVAVREIAAAIDIYEIREERLDGLEGALVTPPDKNGGAILVRFDRPETRRRFTIAHELGHYVNPWHRSNSPSGFRCTTADMSTDRFRKGDFKAEMEAQANEFAAELLMPSRRMTAQLAKSKGVDLTQIVRVADVFEVSKEAAARRYVNFAKEPVAVVFGKDGKVRYSKKRDDFPWLEVKNGDLLPIHKMGEIGEISEWFERRAGVWSSKPTCHQILPQANGFCIVLIALDDSDEDYSSDDED